MAYLINIIMGQFYYRRIRQVIRYGWKDAGMISHLPDVKKFRLSIFFDILSCFRKYYIFSNQYKSKQVWKLSDEEKSSILEPLGNKNREKDQWLDIHYSDWKFLIKYTDLKWQKTPDKINKRRDAYIKHYGLGQGLHVQYGVIIICEHYSAGKITCGKNVLLARGCDIDYTGDIKIGDNVGISEGVKILTHNHSTGMDKTDLEKGCILTPITIHDNVWIGARAMIMPGVSEIGRGAVISADAYVNSKIPPYAIVMGNPAKIVGFKKSPEEILEYEKENYDEKDCIPADIIYGNYDKYFRGRWKEIKQWIKL